jgi:GTPase SAR1 family protein
MSLTSNKTNSDGVRNLPIAIVKGGELAGALIYLKEPEKSLQVVPEEPIKMINLPLQNSSFEQYPNDKTRVIYIAGPSGSGKTTYAANYIKQYLKRKPDTPFIVFSRLKEDPVIDCLNPKRIEVCEDLITDPIEIEDIDPDSIILFDDCETISNRSILSAINKIKAQILELGRHNNIQIVITSHLINGSDKEMTRIILNEMHTLTIFPTAGSAYQIKYVLKNYFGLSTKQMKGIFNLKSRWITIFKTYPQIVIGQNDIKFISTL